MTMDLLELRDMCIREDWCDMMDCRKYDLLFKMASSLNKAETPMHQHTIWNRMRNFIFWNSSKFEDLQMEVVLNGHHDRWIEEMTGIGTTLSLLWVE